jgi:hypothetical protein
MTTLDARLEKSDGCRDDAVNTCPTCDAPIAGIVTRGPGVHEAAECGHRLSQQYIGQYRGAANDGKEDRR